MDQYGKDFASYIEYLLGVRHLSPHTIIAYRKDLDLFYQFLLLRSIDLYEVTYPDARRYVAHLIQQKYAETSVQRMIASVRGFYAYAYKRGLCSYNPFSRIESTTRRRRLPEILSREEVITILSVPIVDFLSLRNSTMFHLFYATGCRLSELLSANIDDIDSEQQRLLVRGKGGKERFCFFTPMAKEILVRYLSERTEWVLAHGEDNRALLVDTRGKRLSASSVHSIFDAYRVKLGLRKNIYPHMLRHSFATHMLDNNSGIRIVQELLGHASISTTQIYTHVSYKRLRRVYEESHPHGRK